MRTKVGAAANVGGLHVGFSVLLLLMTKLVLTILGFGHAPTLYCIRQLVVLARLPF